MGIEQQIETFITAMIANYGWYIIGVAALVFLRSTVENMVQSWIVFFGRDYDQDDVVLVDGKPGRIIRTSLWRTTFFLYTIEDGKVIGGNKLVVENSELKNIRIEKPLQVFPEDLLKDYEKHAGGCYAKKYEVEERNKVEAEC